MRKCSRECIPFFATMDMGTVLLLIQFVLIGKVLFCELDLSMVQLASHYTPKAKPNFIICDEVETKRNCHKCVYEVGCTDNPVGCKRYKRDAPDGGYYG